MAELALAVAGLALAWKGILDFGQLMSQLMDDDELRRDILVTELESSQYILKDWGDHWGVDRNDGRFHALEPSRKMLIMKIIFQLRDSRAAAMKTLRGKYGIPADEDEEPIEERAIDSGRRLSKMAAKVISATKRGKEKSRWVIFNRTVVEGLVAETFRLHKCLNYLTSLSIKFLNANLVPSQDVQSLDVRFTQLEGQIRQLMRAQVAAPSQIYGQTLAVDNQTRQPTRTDMPPDQSPIYELDEQTLTGFATKSIASVQQAECVQGHIDHSFDFHGDTRVAETISEWWNDTQGGILVLEAPDEAGDRTSTSACALLYYLVDCYKLIFILEPNSGNKPAHQLLDMFRTLIQSLVSLRRDHPLLSASSPANLTEMDEGGEGATDPATMSRLISFFLELLSDVLQTSNKRVLIIIDGLELIDWDEEKDLTNLIRSFVSGLQRICSSYDVGSKAVLKALFGNKGHATVLYDCIDDTGIVDVTDRATRLTSMKEELAASLRDCP